MNLLISFPASIVLTLGHIGFLQAQGSFEKPTDCNRQNTLFRHGTSYTYSYASVISSAFVGASESSSGSKFKCQVQINVARKCELFVELQDCRLFERNAGSEETYTEIDAPDFTSELTRSPMYFQMNNGVILEDKIVVDVEEPVYVTNIKRGLLSALQFQLLQADQYNSTLQEVDIFGSCPTKYSFSPDSPGRMTTHRDLAACDLMHIFNKQLNVFASIKRVQFKTGQEKMNEIYPFGSEVNCEYDMDYRKQMQLRRVSCSQIQYFKPSAYNGTVLATAISTISQSLELVSSSKYRVKNVDRSLSGRKMVGVVFQFEADETPPATSAEVAEQMTSLRIAHATNQINEWADKFQGLVNLFRRSSMEVLHDVMEAAYSCDDTAMCDKRAEQAFYLDGLLSCGTDTCLEMFAHCLQMNHISAFSGAMFLYSLSLSPIPLVEGVISRVLSFCQSSDRLMCWLPLGTMVSRVPVDGDQLQVDSIVYEVITHLRETIGRECQTESRQVPDSRLIVVFKTLANVGYEKVNLYDNTNDTDKILPALEQCVQSKSMSTPARRAAVQALKEVLDKTELLTNTTKDALFSVLADMAGDTTLRILALQMLIEDENEDTILRILKLSQDDRQTSQMKSYIYWAVTNLLENDKPDKHSLRAMWQELIRSHQYQRLLYTQSYTYKLGSSKKYHFSRYFKLPLMSDAAGGSFVIDLMYDPAQVVFQTVTISLNYFHGQTYNLFELTTDIHGVDAIFDALFSRNGRSLYQLYGLYMGAGAPGMGTSNVPPFADLQKYLAKQIIEILNTVNYPRSADIVFHLKLYGQEFGLLSLDDIKEMMGLSMPQMQGRPQGGPHMGHHGQPPLKPPGPHGAGMPPVGSHGEGMPTPGPLGEGMPPPGPHGERMPPPGPHGERMPPPGPHGEGMPPPGSHGPGMPPPGSHGPGMPPPGSHGPGGRSGGPPPFFMMIVQKLRRGLRYSKISSMKAVELIKVLPTCAGVPLNMSVEWSGVAHMGLHASMDLMGYLRKTGPGETSFNWFARVNDQLSCQLMLDISRFHSSGIRLQVNGLVDLDSDIGMTFSHKRQPPDTPLSFSMSWKFRDMNSDRERMFSLRSQMILLHHLGSEIIPAGPHQTTYHKCYLQSLMTAVNQNVCVDIHYPDVSHSTRHAYFPLSGPFDFEFYRSKEPGTTGDFNVTFMYSLNIVETGPVHHFGLDITTPEPDTDLPSKGFSCNLTLDSGQNDLQLHAALPRAAVNWDLQFLYASKRGQNDIVYSNTLTQDGDTLLGYLFEAHETRNYSGNRRHIMADGRWKVAFPGMSLDIGAKFEKEGYNVPDIDSLMELNVTYYCAKYRPLLYIFHLDPVLAARNGDTTEIRIHNRVDMGFVTFEPFVWENIDNIVVEYTGQKVTVDNVMVANLSHAHRDTTIGYLVDGQKKEIVMSADVYNNSNENSWNYDYNLNADGDQYNIVMDGHVTGNKQDVDVDVNLVYTNNEVEPPVVDNTVERKRRNVKSLSDRFRALEEIEATETEIQEVQLMVEEDGVHLSADREHKSPPAPVIHPNIWNMATWQLNTHFVAKRVPVFDEDPNTHDGEETQWSLNMSYPWNGAQNKYMATGRFGKNLKNSFGYFKYWFYFSEETESRSFSSPLSTPVTVHRHLNAYTKRKRHDMFDFIFQLDSVIATVDFDVKFNQSNEYTEDPVIHMHNHISSVYFPLLNYDHEECYYHPTRSDLKHTLVIVHPLFSWKANSTFQGFRFGDGPDFSQNSSITLGPNSEPVEFTTKLYFRRGIVLVVNYKDRVRAYSMTSPNRKSLEFQSYVLQDDDEPGTAVICAMVGGCRVMAGNDTNSLMWTWTMSLSDVSTLLHTFSWSPNLTTIMTGLLRNSLMFAGGTLNTASHNMMHNLQANLTDVVIPFTSTNIGYVLRRYILPYVVVLRNKASEYASNVQTVEIPEGGDHQQRAPPQPRMVLLLRGIERIRRTDETITGVVLQTTVKTAAVVLRGLGSTFSLMAYILQKSSNFHQIVADRQFTLLMPLVIKPNTRFSPFSVIFDSVPILPMRQVWRFGENVYHHFLPRQIKMEHPTSGYVMARQFGPQPMSIITYDGKYISIPAPLSSQCTYLLTADAALRRFALVLSPDGVTLVTPDGSVTIDKDNNIFQGQCQIPLSLPVMQDKLAIELVEDLIEVRTQQGIELSCSTLESYMCQVTLTGPTNLNQTVGLLGNNDGEQVTDLRKLDGSHAENEFEFLREYILSGPEMCLHYDIKPDTGLVCNEDVHKSCDVVIQPYRSPFSHCIWKVKGSPFYRICKEESKNCESQRVDTCHVMSAYSALCETRGYNVNKSRVEDLCRELQRPLPPVHSTGVLDVVVVMSLHQSMRIHGKEPWEILQNLLTVDAKFRDVRVGVVAYNGEGESLLPHAVKQHNDYFADAGSIDWGSLEALTATGTQLTAGFTALDAACNFPFRLNAHKLLLLFTNKDPGIASNLEDLVMKLTDLEIIFNVFTTHPKLQHKHILGVDWQGEIITKKDKMQGTLALPTDDYSKLVKATHGAVFDLLTIAQGRSNKVSAILDHMVYQTNEQASNTCPQPAPAA